MAVTSWQHIVNASATQKPRAKTLWLALTATFYCHFMLRVMYSSIDGKEGEHNVRVIMYPAFMYFSVSVSSNSVCKSWSFYCWSTIKFSLIHLYCCGKFFLYSNFIPWYLTELSTRYTPFPSESVNSVDWEYLIIRTPATNFRLDFE